MADLVAALGTSHETMSGHVACLNDGRSVARPAEDRLASYRVDRPAAVEPQRAGVALPAGTGQDVSSCANRTSPRDVLPREALR